MTRPTPAEQPHDVSVSAGSYQPDPGEGPVHHQVGWHLRLYVAGGHDRSRCAIESLRRLSASHIPFGTLVEVVDIHRATADALRHNVLVAPTLLRLSPPPIRRVVGDLSDTPALLRGLDLPGA